MVVSGDVLTDRKSSFQAHVAPVCHSKHVRYVACPRLGGSLMSFGELDDSGHIDDEMVHNGNRPGTV